MRVNGSAVLGECHNQSLITDSSAYAETYQISEGVKYVFAYLQILKELDIKLSHPSGLIPIYTDSSAARQIAIKIGMTKRSRHFDIRCMFYRQYVGKLISIEKIGTDDNPTDTYTKATGVSTFIKHRDSIMVKEEDLIIDQNRSMQNLELLYEQKKRDAKLARVSVRAAIA